MEKLTAGEKQRALDNIDEYYDHLNNQNIVNKPPPIWRTNLLKMNMMTETTFPTTVTSKKLSSVPA